MRTAMDILRSLEDDGFLIIEGVVVDADDVDQS